MTRFGWIVSLSMLLVVLVAGRLFMWWHARTVPPAPAVSEEVTTEVSPLDPSALAIYTSGEYGFSFFYPAQGVVTDTFSTSSVKTPSWREYASFPGTSIVRIASGDVEIRVGESVDKREIDRCLKTGSSEKVGAPLTVGSTTWSVFTSEKLGTEDEKNVTSYRTVHESSCVAFEVFKPRTTQTPPEAYTSTDSIMSFTFAR